MTTESDEEHRLLSVPAEEYGDAYREHLLEQYKLYVESANHISDRRSTANNYFLTINTSLVTLYALAVSFADNRAWHAAVPIAGIIVCVAWFILIRSYRNLNTAKFAVIHELEKQLPAALFAHEWAIVEEGKGKVYKPLSHVEQYIPFIFISLYVVLAAFVFLSARTSQSTPVSHPPTASSSSVQPKEARQP